MNRRQFLEYTAVAGALAGTSAFGQATTPADTQPAGTDAAAEPAEKDAAADRMKFVTYCGLYCGLCDWHARLPQRAAALKESLQRAECPPPNRVQQYLVNLARENPKKHCRGGTCGAKCAIKKCAIAKGVAVCADCNDYPCDRVKILAKSEPTLIYDGLRSRKIGLEAWIEEQEQRKARGFCYADVRCLPCTVPEE